LQFSKEEDADIASRIPSLHDVSPSAFITAGLDLEEEQYVFTLTLQDNGRGLICVSLGGAFAFRRN
jgi:hypothetical protein